MPRLSPYPRVTVKPGRERSLRLRHPWVFSGAIAKVDGAPGAGETVSLVDADGQPLAVGGWSPHSQIRARVWSFDPTQTVDADFFRTRIAAAIGRRKGLLDSEHNACRLIHAESDGLPGVVADRYGDVVVVQIVGAGAEAWRDVIIDALLVESGCRTVFERSDADVRALEGLAPRSGLAAGPEVDRVDVVEDGLHYSVDVVRGQKTGFFLDQRDNRKRVRSHADRRAVLNCFCYTGAFTVAAHAGGAVSSLSIDSSADALALARHNLERNGIADAGAELREADVFAELRRLRDRGASFDMIVLDPPKFAPTAQHAEKASRAYKDINLLSLKLLRPGGVLATFSCSGGVSPELFQKIVAGAASDAGADAVILERFAASADHPVALSFPEGEYLKGLLLQKR